MRRFGFDGGVISSRMASNTTLNRQSYGELASEVCVLLKQPPQMHKPAHDLDVDLHRTGLRRAFDSMATPCSVNRIERSCDRRGQVASRSQIVISNAWTRRG
jgi:hypothetical protein